MTVAGTILITDCDHPSTEIERAMVEAAGFRLEVADCRTAADVIAAGTTSAAAGLIVQYAPITGEVLRALPACRVVGRYGVGLDTIDLETAASLDIRVVNVPDYCTDEVADHALGLILALTRGIVPLDRGVQAGIWDFRLAGRVRRPSSQQVGVVGLGRIGSAFARRARALGYTVVGSDPLGPRASDVQVVELDDLLADERHRQHPCSAQRLDPPSHRRANAGADASHGHPGQHQPRRPGRPRCPRRRPAVKSSGGGGSRCTRARADPGRRPIDRAPERGPDATRRVLQRGNRWSR